MLFLVKATQHFPRSLKPSASLLISTLRQFRDSLPLLFEFARHKQLEEFNKVALGTTPTLPFCSSRMLMAQASVNFWHRMFTVAINIDAGIAVPVPQRISRIRLASHLGYDLSFSTVHHSSPSDWDLPRYQQPTPCPPYCWTLMRWELGVNKVKTFPDSSWKELYP